MNRVEEIGEYGSPGICWKAMPIQYDNYPQEKNDNYSGNVFGTLWAFESPNYLWRRFHKNMCKAMAISKLKNYSLDYSEDDDNSDNDIVEIVGHENVSFSIAVLSRHQSLVLLVSGFEAYLKDSFAAVLKLQPKRYESSSIEKVIRRYNFQNVDSINKAFYWLLGTDAELINKAIEPGLMKRHRIIHESFYDDQFTLEELDKYYVDFLLAATALDDVLEVEGYYKQINETGGEDE